MYMYIHEKNYPEANSFSDLKQWERETNWIVTVPLLKGHPFCNEKWPYKKGDLSWAEQFSSILLSPIITAF